MFYVNKEHPLILNSTITEWDIKAANVSIMRNYNLIDSSIIDEIESLSKEDRVRRVGLLQRDNPQFAKILEDSFNDMVNIFITANNIPADNIVSIKRDAVFVKDFNIKQSIFNHVSFIPKNEYKAYIYIPQYEFYISEDKVDVKGIPDSKITLHDKGILQFIKDITLYSSDIYQANIYLKEFVSAYKNRELPIEYYRQFNGDSNYLYIDDGYSIPLDSITDDDINRIDISYNYTKVILPIIQLYL